MTTQGTQVHHTMKSMWSADIVNIVVSRREPVPERDIAGITTRSYDMVYFQCRTYRAGKISITVIRISKSRDRLTYRFANGDKDYSVPIHWSRVRNIEHPVQYINVKGSRIWAL